MPRNRAATRPEADDPRLRTPSYAVPFDRVWRAALAVAGASRGWTVTDAAANTGRIQAEARTSLWKFVDDVEVRVHLDPDGLTRVDVASASRRGGSDLGANARRIGRFLRRLDERLRAG